MRTLRILIISTLLFQGGVQAQEPPPEEDQGNWDQVNDPNLKPGEEPAPFIEYRPKRPPKRTQEEIFNQPQSKTKTPPTPIPKNPIPEGKMEKNRIEKNPLPRERVPQGRIDNKPIPRNSIPKNPIKKNPLPSNDVEQRS
jgi:hypothetical protein